MTRNKEKGWGRKVLTTSTTYWNGRLQGEHSLPEVQSALNLVGVQDPIILRLDTGGGETTMYFATHSEPPRNTKGIKFQKMHEADVTKLG